MHTRHRILAILELTKEDVSDPPLHLFLCLPHADEHHKPLTLDAVASEQMRQLWNPRLTMLGLKRYVEGSAPVVDTHAYSPTHTDPSPS